MFYNYAVKHGFLSKAILMRFKALSFSGGTWYQNKKGRRF